MRKAENSRHVVSRSTSIGRVAESGLRHSTRNRACCKRHRGFESHPFRHFPMNEDPNGKFPARYRMTAILYGGVLLFLILSATNFYAADWPAWCGQPSHNMASETEKGLPDWYALGGMDFDPAATKNIKWFVKLGDFTGGSPVVSQGRVFIGTKDGQQRMSCSVSTSRRAGSWGDSSAIGRPDRVEHWGVCSTPTVEGDRLYRGDALWRGAVRERGVVAGLTDGNGQCRGVRPAHCVEIRHGGEAAGGYRTTRPVAPRSCWATIVYVCTGNGRFKTTEAAVLSADAELGGLRQDRLGSWSRATTSRSVNGSGAGNGRPLRRRCVNGQDADSFRDGRWAGVTGLSRSIRHGR